VLFFLESPHLTFTWVHVVEFTTKRDERLGRLAVTKFNSSRNSCSSIIDELVYFRCSQWAEPRNVDNERLI